MRVWMTGGTGFVGSNIVRAAVRDGHDVSTTIHSFQAVGTHSYSMQQVDMAKERDVLASIE